MQLYSISEHFLEIKARVLKVIVLLISAFLISYLFSDYLYSFLLKPLKSVRTEDFGRIIYTDLTEAFFTYMKLSFYTAIFFTVPYICLQIYLFLKPGLFKGEQQIAKFVLFFAPILFWTGGAFVYYYVMPKAYLFFLSFETNKLGIPLVLEAKISEYLALSMTLIFAFGFAFQLPVVMVMLNLLKLVNVETYKRKRRYAIVVNFIASGILTPPDVISQFALAIPLLLLYEISIIACKLIDGRKQNA